jgi:xanthine dehydrogenase YagR molybdenum-binding subunit
MSSRPTSVGKPIARVDGALKVSGQARYAADDVQDDVAYGVIVPSSVARGHIEEIHTDEAAGQPGVLAVLTHLNAPRLPYHEHRGSPDPDCGERLHVLKSAAVHFFGQPVAVVVAVTREQAEYAATLLRVQYVQLPVDLELSFERSVTPGSCRGACADFESDTSRGDADAALGSAAARLDRLYGIARQNHHPIEPHGAIAAWDGGQLILRTKSQFVMNERDEIAAIFGIPVEDIRVISPFVGGAFGSALRTWPHVVIAAMCARELRRPVAVQLDRRQMATLTGSRPESRQRVALGAARDGRLAAIVHEVVHETSRYEEYVEDVLDVSTYLYSCPNVRTRYRIAPRDVSTPTWMRAPGEASGIFALECAMDELAAQLGVDPIELRLRNEPERDEREGLPFSSRSIRECYQAAAEHFGWARRTPEPRSMRDGDMLIGWGMAASTYPAYFSDRAQASIRLHLDGTMEVAAASSDMGPGTYTSLTQVAADAMGVGVERVRVRLGDSTLPHAPSHGGSQTMASVGAAVRAACEAAHQEVRRLCAGESDFVAALKSSNLESIEVRGRAAASQGSERFSKHAFGAVFAEVAVDAVSCELRVRRLVGAYAAGRIVNPRLARSQCIGGMVGGIEQDPHVNTLGVKGIAEIALVGVAPAIANAVYHATGRRIRSLPITLDRLL